MKFLNFFLNSLIIYLCIINMLKIYSYSCKWNIAMKMKSISFNSKTNFRNSKLSISPIKATISTNIDDDSNIVPMKPINFNKAFYLPKYTAPLYLEQINSHPNDTLLEFDATSHTYVVNGAPMKVSVTSLISSYFKQFDADDIIQKMMNGSNWPRDGYIDTRTNQPFTPEQIKQKWDNIGEYSRNYGTWVHYNIERYLNHKKVAEFIEMQQFFQFKEDMIDSQGIESYRTEWRIAAPELGIAGSVDFVGRKDDGTFTLIDWKTSRNLKSSLINSYNQKANFPIQHLDDCDGSKYFLQLNMYKYILEKYYHLPISSMILVSFSSKLSEYFSTHVPDLSNEIEDILKDFKTLPLSQSNKENKDNSDLFSFSSIK